MAPYTQTQQKLDEIRQTQNLARAIREGTRTRTERFAPDLGESIGQLVQNSRRFNEETRNTALLLAASQRLRRFHFWKSTVCLFVLPPVLTLAWYGICHYFVVDLIWTYLVLFAVLIALPLYALKGYFIWVRSHWYRWIGQGIVQEYGGEDDEDDDYLAQNRPRADPANEHDPELEPYRGMKAAEALAARDRDRAAARPWDSPPSLRTKRR